jgi:outer membrane lipoprotein-sorting protein
LQAANAGLEDCKGLGQVTLRTGSKSQRARLAWAAKVPDKLRLELLAVSGHPLAALASDGSHLYLRDNTTERFHKSNSPEANLEQLVQVPLRVSDLIAYLLGRIPTVTAERMVQMDNPHEPGYILELSRWWGAISQRIFLKPDGKTITRVVNFAAEGKIAYQVNLADHRPEGEFLFARRLSAFTPEGDRIDMRLERFWPNAGIDEGAFQLTR